MFQRPSSRSIYISCFYKLSHIAPLVLYKSPSSLRISHSSIYIIYYKRFWMILVLFLRSHKGSRSFNMSIVSGRRILLALNMIHRIQRIDRSGCHKLSLRDIAVVQIIIRCISRLELLPLSAHNIFCIEWVSSFELALLLRPRSFYILTRVRASILHRYRVYLWWTWVGLAVPLPL